MDRIQPDISVVIAFYNRKELVPVVLNAVFAQKLETQRTFEVIAVDNGSTDGTRQLLEQWPNLTVIECPKPGAASARNAGIAVANAPIVAITDSDCEPQPSWLQELTAPLFDNPTLAGTGGRIDAMHMNTGVEMYAHLCGILNQRDFFEGVLCFPPFFATANVAWRRDVLIQAGGFNENVRFVAEDSDLCWRILNLGTTVTYVDKAVVKHAHRDTIIGLFRQSVAYGESAVRVFAMHCDKMGTGRMFFNWASYYGFVLLPARCLLAWIFGFNSFQRRAPFYEWIWRAGNLYGNIKESIRRRVIFFA